MVYIEMVGKFLKKCKILTNIILFRLVLISLPQKYTLLWAQSISNSSQSFSLHTWGDCIKEAKNDSLEDPTVRLYCSLISLPTNQAFLRATALDRVQYTWTILGAVPKSQSTPGFWPIWACQWTSPIFLSLTVYLSIHTLLKDAGK